MRILNVVITGGLFLVSTALGSTQTRKEEYYPANAKLEFGMVGEHKTFFLRADRSVENGPWVWFAPVILAVYDQPPNQDIRWMFENLLERGISVAGIDVGESYGSPKGTEIYNLFYEQVVRTKKLSRKPCLLVQSRGGLMLYSWAIRHPSSVACIAGIYPVVNLNSWPASTERGEVEKQYDRMPFSELVSEFNPVEHLGPLAAAHVPLFNIHGFDDHIVSYGQNSEKLTNEYNVLGGHADLVTVRGEKHGHVRGDALFFESPEMLSFLVRYSR